MGSILYVGNDNYYKVLQQAADSLKIKIEIIPDIGTKDINMIITYIEGYIDSKDDIIVVNYSNFKSADFFKIINGTVEISNVCLVCKGVSVKNKNIKKSINMGVKFWLSENDDKKNINDFRDYLNGDKKDNAVSTQNSKHIQSSKTDNADNNTNVIPNETAAKINLNNIINDERNEEDKENEEDEEYTKTIVVAGCVPRIGTTTVSIHMLSVLFEKGKKVCYVDKSENNYIYWLTRLYGDMGVIDMEHHKYTLNNIDFYFMINRQVLDYIYDECDYDYILYDIGVVKIQEIENTIITKDEHKIKMLQKADYSFLCCGSKCNEYFATNAIITNNDCSNMYLMFYSVSQEDQEDMKSFCKQYSKRTYFVPYIDNEFIPQKNTTLFFNKIFK